MKCTRQRCHEVPSMVSRIEALSPEWASETTGLRISQVRNTGVNHE